MKKSMKKLLSAAIGTALTLTAAMSVFATEKEMVNVTIPNVRGGIISASYEDNGKTVYLPIGETTKVPKGTLLEYDVEPLDYYNTKEDIYYEGLISSLKINNKKISVDTQDSYDDEVTVKSDTKFDVAFKCISYAETDVNSISNYAMTGNCKLYFCDEYGEIIGNGSKAGIWNAEEADETVGKMVFLDGKKVEIPFCEIDDVKFEKVHYSCMNGKTQKLADNFFNLDENGLLWTEKGLKEGNYAFNITVVVDEREFTRHFEVYIGRRVVLHTNVFKYIAAEDDDEYEYRIANSKKIPILASDSNATTFENIFNEYVNGKVMLGKYEPTKLGDYSDDFFEEMMDENVEEQMLRNGLPMVSVDIQFDEYEPVLVEHLTEEDLIEETVNPGWGKDDNGDKCYYMSADPDSMLKGEILELKGKTYYFDNSGSLVKGTKITINGVTYTADNNGVLTKVADDTNKPGTDEGNTGNPGTNEGNTGNPGTGNGNNTNKPSNGGSSSGSGSGSSSSSGSGSGSSSGGGSSKKPTTTTNALATEKGTWVQNGNGWTITLSDGTTPKSRWARLAWGDSSQWYYFNENGQMATGWVLSNGKWYYLHPESDGTQGYMHTGWNQINDQWFYMNPVEGDTTGAVLTGWQLINGKWYYFSEVKDSTEGMMLSNTTTPDGYQVGADGAWIQ